MSIVCALDMINGEFETTAILFQFGPSSNFLSSSILMEKGKLINHEVVLKFLKYRNRREG